MIRSIEKVTAFIASKTDDKPYLLLIDHPNAGIQIPAGTVEPTETPEQAILRETFEETGLSITSTPMYLGCRETQLSDDEAIILPPATVYARPDLTSFDWIQIRSAVQVKVRKHSNGFTQITYIEYDHVPNPQDVSMQITGWVDDTYLATLRKRHFYYLKIEAETDRRWQVFTDHHTFTLFWAPLTALPEIIHPQNTWLEFLSQTPKSTLSRSPTPGESK
jgi:8-oxo-dGTP pyrophosphatase MutT (NUDIX family)